MIRAGKSAALVQRAVGGTGLVWGGLLLAAGPRLWRLTAGREPDDVELVTVYVLGLRHVGQGLAQVAFAGHGRRLWIAVDLLHAATMVGLAVKDPDRRRPALVSGAVATLSALVTTVVATASSRH